MGQHMYQTLVLIASVQKPPLNTHADVSSESRGLNFGLHLQMTLHLHSYLEYARKEDNRIPTKMCWYQYLILHQLAL